MKLSVQDNVCLHSEMCKLESDSSVFPDKIATFKQTMRLLACFEHLILYKKKQRCLQLPVR